MCDRMEETRNHNQQTCPKTISQALKEVFYVHRGAVRELKNEVDQLKRTVTQLEKENETLKQENRNFKNAVKELKTKTADGVCVTCVNLQNLIARLPKSYLEVLAEREHLIHYVESEVSEKGKLKTKSLASVEDELSDDENSDTKTKLRQLRVDLKRSRRNESKSPLSSTSFHQTPSPVKKKRCLGKKTDWNTPAESGEKKTPVSMTTDPAQKDESEGAARFISSHLLGKNCDNGANECKNIFSKLELDAGTEREVVPETVDVGSTSEEESESDSDTLVTFESVSGDRSTRDVLQSPESKVGEPCLSPTHWGGVVNSRNMNVSVDLNVSGVSVLDGKSENGVSSSPEKSDSGREISENSKVKGRQMMNGYGRQNMTRKDASKLNKTNEAEERQLLPEVNESPQEKNRLSHGSRGNRSLSEGEGLKSRQLCYDVVAEAVSPVFVGNRALVQDVSSPLVFDDVESCSDSPVLIHLTRNTPETTNKKHGKTKSTLTENKPETVDLTKSSQSEASSESTGSQTSTLIGDRKTSHAKKPAGKKHRLRKDSNKHFLDPVLRFPDRNMRQVTLSEVFVSNPGQLRSEISPERRKEQKDVEVAIQLSLQVENLKQRNENQNNNSNSREESARNTSDVAVNSRSVSDSKKDKDTEMQIHWLTKTPDRLKKTDVDFDQTLPPDRSWLIKNLIKDIAVQVASNENGTTYISPAGHNDTTVFLQEGNNEKDTTDIAWEGGNSDDDTTYMSQLDHNDTMDILQQVGNNEATDMIQEAGDNERDSNDTAHRTKTNQRELDGIIKQTCNNEKNTHSLKRFAGSNKNLSGIVQPLNGSLDPNITLTQICEEQENVGENIEQRFHTENKMADRSKPERNGTAEKTTERCDILDDDADELFEKFPAGDADASHAVQLGKDAGKKKEKQRTGRRESKLSEADVFVDSCNDDVVPQPDVLSGCHGNQPEVAEESEGFPSSSRSYKFGSVKRLSLKKPSLTAKNETLTVSLSGNRQEKTKCVRSFSMDSVQTKQSLDDSFDRVPKKNDVDYAYVDVVRKKQERKNLPASTCQQCYEYYKSTGMSEEEIQKRIQNCSRHRDRFARPLTPEHFWSIGFPDTNECIERGYIQYASPSSAKPSKYRRRHRLQKRFKSKNEEETSDNESDGKNNNSDIE